MKEIAIFSVLIAVFCTNCCILYFSVLIAIGNSTGNPVLTRSASFELQEKSREFLSFFAGLLSDFATTGDANVRNCAININFKILWFINWAYAKWTHLKKKYFQSRSFVWKLKKWKADQEI